MTRLTYGDSIRQRRMLKAADDALVRITDSDSAGYLIGWTDERDTPAELERNAATLSLIETHWIDDWTARHEVGGIWYNV